MDGVERFPLDPAVPTTRGDASGAVMFQRWQNLLFAHWAYDPAVIQRTLPAGLEVDTHDGMAWVGVVPFRMAAVRPRFLPPVPGLSWFWELNVRTYVRDRNGRTGVWFYSLDCNQPLACALARRFFHLNYRDAEMGCTRAADGGFEYRSQRPGCGEPVRLRWLPAADPPSRATPGSLRHFLVERYRLFAGDPETGRLWAGEVAHEPYQIVPAEVKELEVKDLFVSNRLPVPTGEPGDVVASVGVRVRVCGVKTIS